MKDTGPPPAFTLVPWWRSFVLRFTGMLVAGIVALIAVGIHRLHVAQKREVEERFGLALESIAATAAPFLDASDVERVRTNADVEGPAFRRLRAALDQVRRNNHLQEDQVYLLRPGAADAYHFVVMLQRRTFVGDAYHPPPSVRANYRWARDHRDAVRTSLYTDAHGSFISGIAPVAAPDGRVVALLQIDYDLEMYLAEVDRRAGRLLGGAALVVALIVALGLWTQYRLRRRVLALLAGTRAVAAEDYDHRVPVSGGDEIGALATALNAVLGHLKERFEMLRFLPRHTRRMIHSAAAGRVRLDDGRRVRVVVLESDIRGFSALSERLSPEDTIHMLNLYVRVQVEVIEAAGGSIDKFMGDAVLAVFEGDGMERRAVACAVAMQRAVVRQNAAGVFAVPVHIGVGLSAGDVVMGNVGSEDRMEHTVIGAVVNLAARLCSAAGRGEVVLARPLWDAAGGATDVAPGAPEQLDVKGFERPVECVRLLVTDGAAAATP